MSEPEQLDLLATAAHARAGDPWTSHAAARSLDPDRLRATQAAVLACFQYHGPMHHEALLAAYAARRWQPPQSPSGLRTRTRELVEGGLLRNSGRTVRLPSGRASIIWEVQPDE